MHELNRSDLTRTLVVTLADSEQLTELVVPHTNFAALSASSDQTEMVAELNSCYAMNVSSSYTSEHLAGVVLFGIDEVPGAVSIDQLVHLVFPDENHVNDLSLHWHAGDKGSDLVPISITTSRHRWRTLCQIRRCCLLIDIHTGNKCSTSVCRRVKTFGCNHLLGDRAGRRWRLL